MTCHQVAIDGDRASAAMTLAVEKRQRDSAHPFYWAPFVLYGAPE